MAAPIRLGLMPPLTGLVGLYGQEIVNAARIACAEINRQGGNAVQLALNGIFVVRPAWARS